MSDIGDYEIIERGERFTVKSPSGVSSVDFSSQQEAERLALRIHQISHAIDDAILFKLDRIPESTEEIIATIKSQDNVGDGCMCIYPFEKHYIKLLINGEIEHTESDHKKMREWKPEAEMSSEEEARHRKLMKQQLKLLNILTYETLEKSLKDLRKCLSVNRDVRRML